MANSIQEVLINIQNKLISDIESNPPEIGPSDTLYLQLRIVDGDGDYLKFGGEDWRAGQMESSELRDCLSEWASDQSEGNREEVSRVFAEIFSSMFLNEGEIVFNDVTEKLPKSIDYTESYFALYAGDYSDQANPMTYADLKYYLSA